MDRKNCFVSTMCCSLQWLLRTPGSPDCSGLGALPKFPRLGSVSLCCRTKWLGLCQPCEGVRTWTHDAALLTGTPKARMFTGQDCFIPVWLSLHYMIRWPFSSYFSTFSFTLPYRQTSWRNDLYFSVKAGKIAANSIPVICDDWVEVSDSFSILIFGFLGCGDSMVKVIINCFFFPAYMNELFEWYFTTA